MIIVAARRGDGDTSKGRENMVEQSERREIGKKPKQQLTSKGFPFLSLNISFWISFFFLLDCQTPPYSLKDTSTQLTQVYKVRKDWMHIRN